MKVERLEYKHCPECGALYQDTKEQPAPARCEIDGESLVPVYAIYGEVIATNARTGLASVFDAEGVEVGQQG